MIIHIEGSKAEIMKLLSSFVNNSIKEEPDLEHPLDRAVRLNNEREAEIIKRENQN